MKEKKINNYATCRLKLAVSNKRSSLRKAMALKKWGFGSVGAASKFCQKNKSKK